MYWNPILSNNKILQHRLFRYNMLFFWFKLSSKLLFFIINHFFFWKSHYFCKTKTRGKDIRRKLWLEESTYKEFVKLSIPFNHNAGRICEQQICIGILKPVVFYWYLCNRRFDDPAFGWTSLRLFVELLSWRFDYLIPKTFGTSESRNIKSSEYQIIRISDHQNIRFWYYLKNINY